MVLNLSSSYKPLIESSKEIMPIISKEEKVIITFPWSTTGIFKWGYTIDTAITPFSQVIIIGPTYPDLTKIKGFIIRFGLNNSSGATDTFTINIQNTTKNSYILKPTTFTISNYQFYSEELIVGLDKITPGNDTLSGDTLTFNITEGVIGTNAASNYAGLVTEEVNLLIETIL